jgi:hypothetical protein
MESLRQDRIKEIDSSQPQSIEAALDGLYHDEHIDVAIRCGIFNSAYVIQHSHYHLLPEWIEHDMVVCPTEIDLHAASDQEKFNYYDLALEDEFLDRQLKQLAPDFSLREHNYILDIDLDYFKTRKALMPASNTVIKQLVDESIGVTIAKESEWTQRLFLEDPMAPSEMIGLLCDLLENRQT